MSDTAIAELPPQAEPAPKRKYKPRRHARANKRPTTAPMIVSEKPKPGPFAGMTANDCCSTCSMERCAITGKDYCGHPYKGGLRHGDMNNPEVILRMQEAKKILAHSAVDKRLA